MQEAIDYKRIADAINYITEHFKEQPSLNAVAEAIHLSPYHFQRMFTTWAGVSPKKFMQYLTVNYAKTLLKESETTLFDVAHDTGLSSTSRLHDLFIKIEGMTPAEYKNGGQKLLINYSFMASPFGEMVVASTEKGICHMAFIEDKNEGKEVLKKRFPNAVYRLESNAMQEQAALIFQQDWTQLNSIKLHLKGTPFQLKVWETLLKVPMGRLATYGTIAHQIGKTKASRAVGTAIGSNPVAFLIPCHRVIRASGESKGYMWGNTRKSAIIGWEGAQTNRG